MTPVQPDHFSRRAFVAFLFLAPAGFLCIGLILGMLQYKQFRGMISASADLPAASRTPADAARADSLASALKSFAAGSGSDTLTLSAAALDQLAAASPVSRSQGLRFRFFFSDSLMTVQTTQPVSSMQGRLAWIFRHIAPDGPSYLNARMEGAPSWEEGKLEFQPEKGYLGGISVPKTALEKRKGLSPRDFVEGDAVPAYEDVLRVLDKVSVGRRGVSLIRRRS